MIDRPTAEQALLGACLTGYRDIPGIEQIIRPTDFTAPVHEVIWNAILATYATGHEVNILTVLGRISETQLSQFGLALKGGVYLQELCQACPGVPGMAEEYARQVVEAANWDGLGQIITTIQQSKRDGLDAEEARQVVAERVHEMEVRTHVEHVTPGAGLQAVLDVADSGNTGAIPTKWPDLDHQISGLFPGQLVVLGARPGVGKSIFAENLGTHVAWRCGLPVYFATLEMSSFEVTQRTVANLARVSLQSLRNGGHHMTEHDWERVNRSTGMIQELPIWHSDGSGQTVADIRSGAFQMRRHFGKPPLVIVDYLQLMESHGGSRTQSRQQEIGVMTRGLKRLAKDLGTPVVALSQLKRTEGRNHRPEMSDLRESGDIEQDADTIILLHQPDEYDQSGLEALIPKQRSGPTGGMVPLIRQGWWARIDSPAEARESVVA